MAAKLTTLAHLALSSVINFPNPAGESEMGVLPTSASCLLNEGSATIALTAAFSLSTIAAGQSLGAVMPFQE